MTCGIVAPLLIYPVQPVNKLNIHPPLFCHKPSLPARSACEDAQSCQHESKTAYKPSMSTVCFRFLGVPNSQGFFKAHAEIWANQTSGATTPKPVATMKAACHRFQRTSLDSNRPIRDVIMIKVQASFEDSDTVLCKFCLAFKLCAATSCR